MYRMYDKSERRYLRPSHQVVSVILVLARHSLSITSADIEHLNILYFIVFPFSSFCLFCSDLSVLSFPSKFSFLSFLSFITFLSFLSIIYILSILTVMSLLSFLPDLSILSCPVLSTLYVCPFYPLCPVGPVFSACPVYALSDLSLLSEVGRTLLPEGSHNSYLQKHRVICHFSQGSMERFNPR